MHLNTHTRLAIMCLNPQICKYNKKKDIGMDSLRLIKTKTQS